MSIRVAGIWEQGWNTPILEADIWEMAVREFGVEKFYMTPVSGILHPIVIERPSIPDILKENETHTAVFVDEKAETDLTEFKHPENALYVFGRVDHSGVLLYKRESDLSVKFSTPSDTGLLWPHQALVILMYDRFLKEMINDTTIV